MYIRVYDSLQLKDPGSGFLSRPDGNHAVKSDIKTYSFLSTLTGSMHLLLMI